MNGFEGLQPGKESPEVKPLVLKTGVELDFTKRTLGYRGRPIQLSFGEKDLLFLLAGQPRTVMSVDAIIKKLYKEEEFFPKDRKGVVKVRLSYIRRKLIDATQQTPPQERTSATLLKRHFQSHHRRGYYFEPDPTLPEEL